MVSFTAPNAFQPVYHHTSHHYLLVKEVEKELIAAKLINIPTVRSQWKGKTSKLVEILKFKSRVPCFPPTKNDLKRKGGEDEAYKHKSQLTPKGVFSRAQYLAFRK